MTSLVKASACVGNKRHLLPPCSHLLLLPTGVMSIFSRRSFENSFRPPSPAPSRQSFPESEKRANPFYKLRIQATRSASSLSLSSTSPFKRSFDSPPQSPRPCALGKIYIKTGQTVEGATTKLSYEVGYGPNGIASRIRRAISKSGLLSDLFLVPEGDSLLGVEMKVRGLSRECDRLVKLAQYVTGFC